MHDADSTPSEDFLANDSKADADWTPLLLGLIDGQLDPEERGRLQSRLLVDDALRSRYYDLVEMHENLRGLADGCGGKTRTDARALFHIVDSDRSTLTQPAESHRNPRWIGFSGIASRGIIVAGMVAALSYLFFVIRGGAFDGSKNSALASEASSNAPDRSFELTAEGFAVVTRQSSAQWGSGKHRTGDLLTAGRHHLKSGDVELELFSGVRMLVRGEAMFTVHSPMMVSLHRGRARAVVPPSATGFRLRSSAGEVVDHGTEFAVVAGVDSLDVKVIDGAVDLRTGDAETEVVRRLKDGQSASAKANQIYDVGGDSIAGWSTGAFDQMMRDKREERLARFLNFDQGLRRDPRLLALFRGEASSAFGRAFPNVASHEHAERNMPIGDGAIVAAQPSADRWGRPRHALDFGRTGSRVRVQIPGAHRGLTLSCWVRIHSLDRWYNSLFLTDGHEVGEPHWQIMNDGRLFFSVKSDNTDSGKQQHIVFSDPIDPAKLCGRWVMLSVTYDSQSRRVAHFMDGQLLHAEILEREFAVPVVKIGDASICNWSQPMYRSDPEFVVRNLNGDLDALAIFASALSDQEIQDLYGNGNPE
ncbi:MAG: LamG-like jellyroll fold domain-containing protein [Planctomycetota bacterium]